MLMLALPTLFPRGGGRNHPANQTPCPEFSSPCLHVAISSNVLNPPDMEFDTRLLKRLLSTSTAQKVSLPCCQLFLSETHTHTHTRTFMDSAHAATDSCARSSNTPMSTARYTLLSTCSVDLKGGYHVVYAGAGPLPAGDIVPARASSPFAAPAARRSMPG